MAMTRRRAVVLASAAAIFVLAGLAAGLLAALTRTDYGRERIRRYVLAQLAGRVRGTLHLGRIEGSLFDEVRIDSLELRDAADSLFVAAAGITITFDPRDIIDRRVLVSHLDVRRATVVVRKDSTDVWNFRRIFPPGTDAPPRRTERGFGDFVVLDSATLHEFAFVLTQPWTPADSLRGARRDSAIAANLARTDAEIRRGGSGFLRTWRWTEGRLALSQARLAMPDSAGRHFQVARLDVNESYPPFRVRNVRGAVRIQGDSVWLDVPHFDLAASTGRGRGKIWWGSGLPTRYAVRVWGDSVSMSDVAWVYPTLPRTGGGRTVLDIRNDPEDLRVIEYALSSMDVRSTASRVRGAMTFAVGGPVLGVKDVDLAGDPVDFELLKTFNGEPFPYDFRGQLFGTVRGPGGPVNRFRVDEVRVTFRDANVPGAVSEGTGRGELDILSPAFTVFRGFAIEATRFDLRTPQALNALFPRLNGVVSGTAILDSLWLDVRLRDADLTHRDGDGEPTRMTGNGRVTIGDEYLTYDLALAVQPLSFTTLARSYPRVPLRGTYAGALRLQGTIEDLLVTGDLTGPGGTLAVDGRFDLYAPGYAAQGNLRMAGLDLRTLLDTAAAPVTSLDGRLDADVRGDSLADVAGSLRLELDRSLVEGVRLYPSELRASLGEGRLRVDTLRMESAAGSLGARGGLGLVRGADDSLTVAAALDSLGGLRRWLTVRPGEPAESDSLVGVVRATGTLRGFLDSLALRGALAAEGIWVGNARARALRGEFAIDDLLGHPRGPVQVVADTVRLGRVAVDGARADLSVEGREAGRFVVTAASATGERAAVGGNWRRAGDTTAIAVDTASLAIGGNDWRLDRPALLVQAPDVLTLDTLRLRGSRQGAFMVAGRVPERDSVRIAVRGDSIPMADVAALLQSPLRLAGDLQLAADVAGTRDAPRLRFGATLSRGAFGDVRVDRVTAGGSYGDRRLVADATLFRGAMRAIEVTASLPVDLALRPLATRRIDEPLTGRVRSDSVDFGLIEALSPSLRNAGGRFVANLDLGGTWEQPRLVGQASIVDGALNVAELGDVRLRDIQAAVDFHGDSLTIRRAQAATREGNRDGTVQLSGAIGGLRLGAARDPRFDLHLRARNFHALDRARVAHLDVSADLRLAGAWSGATLTGGATVDRGTIVIPELFEKSVISLDDPDFYNIVDTTVFTNRLLMPKAPPEFLGNLRVDNVQIVMGPEVWLRSSEANINLGGAVDVTVAPDRDRPLAQLALTGGLLTNRGTYRLNLGIVQRTFEVEGGTIRFFGEPELNPTLDIRAIHTVRPYATTQFAVQDVRIRVRIGGTLAQPQLELSSADSLLRITETDLVSYLVTGAPNFDIAATGGVGQGTASLLLRTGSSLASDYLRTVTGLDLVDVRLERQAQRTGLNSTFADVLANARFGVGKQITERTFISADAGVCSLFGGGGATDFAEGIGVKIETRLDANLSLALGYEPPTNAQLCGAGTARGFVLTPRQFGLDLFRTWRF